MNEVNINIRTNKSTKSSEKDMFLTGIEPINFYITIKGKTSNLTFLKTFTYTINYNDNNYNPLDYLKDISSLGWFSYWRRNKTFS